MRELFHDLTDWTLQAADSDWAVVLLALVAFSESIVFPIPPDPLLIAVGVASPTSAIWVAALVTVASVSGAYVGHWLGRRVGRPLLRRLVSESKTERAEALFNRYGVWAILVAAFTPIPYKVFTILAGIMDLPIRPFLLASPNRPRRAIHDHRRPSIPVRRRDTRLHRRQLRASDNHRGRGPANCVVAGYFAYRRMRWTRSV